MRPRKNVLLFSALDADMNPLVFVLNTRKASSASMRARATHSAAAFEEQMLAFAPDAVLLFEDCRGASAEKALRACAATALLMRVPALLVSRIGREMPADVPCSMFLGKNQSDVANLLDALRTVLARKRGPKKADSDAQQLVASSVATELARNARLA